jgi:ubiquinone/menaquinone biosynthesis C-methylase UbiE
MNSDYGLWSLSMPPLIGAAIKRRWLRGSDGLRTLRQPGPGRSAQVLSTYERTAARYDRVWRRLWLRVAGASAETAMLRAVVSAVSAMDRPRVLDAGAGTGALSRRLTLALPGVCPVLVDLSPGMLAQAADLHAQRTVASVQALPFADETFDIVVSAWVIETVDSPGVAVTEMLRVLRPGGALVYSFCSRPARRRDRWRSGPTRAVVHALFAGHFLRDEETPFHDCGTSRRNSFAGGAATVIVLGKCCTVATAKARRQMPMPILPCLPSRA